MSDMRVIKTRSRVNDQHVRGDSSGISRNHVIDTAKLGLKRQKTDKSILSENSARDEKLQELACAAVQRDASNEELNPSEIVPGFGGERHTQLKQYNDAQADFDNLVKNKGYDLLSTIEQNYCKNKYNNLEAMHKKCMDLMGKVNARDQGQGHGMVTELVDQAGKELNKAFGDLKGAVKELESFRERVEKTVEARQRIKEVGLSGIEKQDLHYIASINTKKAEEYINFIIERNRSNRTFEGKLILGFLSAYKHNIDEFASVMKTGEIDTAYDHLNTMINAASRVESQLKVHHFGSRIFERIEFEFKNVRDI